MAQKKLVIVLYALLLFFSISAYSDPNSDQWIDSSKSYKDLIEEGYQVKGYSINKINTENKLILLLFVTVLQKGNKVYECQEYQTLDQSLETLDMSIICRELVQPYLRGVGT